jgi:hypothetical protein
MLSVKSVGEVLLIWINPINYHVCIVLLSCSEDSHLIVLREMVQALLNIGSHRHSKLYIV